MEEMARVAGITKPILYRHFGDKAGLCRAIAARKAEQLWEVLGPELDPVRPATGSAGLQKTIDTYLAFCERERAVHTFLAQQGGFQALEAVAHDENFGDRIAALIAERFRQRLIDAGRDPSAAEPWAHAVVGMVTEAAGWWLRTRRMTRTELSAHLLTLIWNGFGELAGAADEGGHR